MEDRNKCEVSLAKENQGSKVFFFFFKASKILNLSDHQLNIYIVTTMKTFTRFSVDFLVVME